MRTVHSFLEQPRDDARLCRDMTPSAFLSMLLDGSLFVARLGSSEDPFEGVPHAP